ncbi:beta family protein [Pseudoalteromonas sp. 78C3]|uniref:beta family protein n=1 Tax=Pseudoalteromonas sp. 78C3 TaxID=2058300 RepID=UPI001E46E56E|nr:beta family protein [Pseudoalteromonas sp. 78C3]
MFNSTGFRYKYIPMLSLAVSEMEAIEELPEKDKELILPLVPLRGWVASNDLVKSICRIEKAIGDRSWIADIDSSFLSDNKHYQLTGKYPRPVFYDIEKLLNPEQGYENWFVYLRDIALNAIPCLQLSDLGQLAEQVTKLKSLKRGVVLNIKMDEVGVTTLNFIADTLFNIEVKELLIICDYGDISRINLSYYQQYMSLLEQLKVKLPTALFSISSTSFPYSFSDSYRGERPIYERLVFNKIRNENDRIRLIYSDRASTRAKRMKGGGGIPPPRVDYPLKDDWRYIRKEFLDAKNATKEEKIKLYQEAAMEVIKSDYWEASLKLWGTQLIERSAKGDSFGITSASKATAVRINIHLYKQLHYDDVLDDLDTDDEWVD